MKQISVTVFVLLFTFLSAQSVDLQVVNSHVKIELTDYQTTDKLVLFRSTTNLQNINCLTNYYPVSSYPLSIEAEIEFQDSLRADNVTYFYKAVLQIDSNSFESQVESIVVPNKELPQLSDPHFIVDKLNYILELWDGNVKIKTYPIALGKNPVKRKLNQDNSSTPEGIYTIYNLQPNATYYKAFDINYPNAVDNARYSYYRQNQLSPFNNGNPSIGDQIQIHGCGIGNNWTFGCMALRDADIAELFAAENIQAGINAIIVGEQFDRDDIPFLLKSRTIENCKILQTSLLQKGYYSGSIDGVYGSATGRALAKFQKDKRLSITCDFDKETTEELLKDPRQTQIDELQQSINIGDDIVIHCFVALCCNQCQGIVPVPEFLGKGDDPNGNLYWGASGGVRTFFDRNHDWKRVKKYAVNDTILERVIYQRKIENSNFYLVADAYHGKYIMNTLDDFLQSSAGNYPCDIEINNKIIYAGGKARLLVYVGHDVLMDHNYTKDIIQNDNSLLRESIILSCISKLYFNSHLSQTGAYPLLWTSGLMAPEAYTLEAAIEGWINLENSFKIRLRAAKAYNDYQNCGLDAAVNLLVSGW